MKNRLTAAITATLCVAVMVSCTHDPQELPVSVSFKNDVQPIFKASCAINSDCHVGASNANAKIDLDSSAAYATIVNKQLVMVSNPTASLLYVEVSTGVMPKPPYARLAQAQVSLILNWIKQGAQNN